MRAHRLIAGATGLLLGIAAVPASADMTLTYWDWHRPRAELVAKYAKVYEQDHPDIHINVQVQTGDFGAKLATAIAAGAPPDITQVHNQWIGSVASGLTPYPASMFPPAQLRADNALFDMVSTYKGQIYYIPEGIMAAGIYYNVDQLAESGIGQPALDWATFTQQAKKLTVKDSNGKIKRAGFNFAAGNFQYLWSDIVYQQGGYLFGPDGGVTLNSPASRAAWQVEVNLLKAGVDIPTQDLSFEQGLSAMKYNWTWYEAFAQAASGLNYDVSMVPTPTGESLPARGRNNVEAGMAVPAPVPTSRKKEAFTFIKWLFDNPKFMVELNVALGTIPTQRDLWTRPELADIPSFRMLKQAVLYTVFPGATEDWFWNLVTDTANRIRSGEPMGSVLPAVQEQGDALYNEHPMPELTERLYTPPA